MGSHGETDGQIDLLQRVARGDTARRISLETGIDKRGIENKLYYMRKVYNCSSTMEMVLKAIANGVIKNPFEK